jgi:hypothetical protein
MSAGTIDLSSGVIQPTRPNVQLGAGGAGVVPMSLSTVKSVVWRAGREPNSAEIQFPTLRLEAFADVDPDTPVLISVKLPGSKSIPVFVGRVATHFGEYDRRAENVSFTALGPRWDLSRDYVLGQERRGQKTASAGAFDFFCFTGYAAVFNHGSKGNKFVGNAEGETGGADIEAVFHSDPRRTWGEPEGEADTVPAFEWNLSEMLTYVYRQRLRTRRYEFRDVVSGAAASPNLVGSPLKEPSTYKGAGTDLVLFDVNVEGMPLNEAYDEVFGAGGIRWWLKPVTTGPIAQVVGHTKKLTAVSTEHDLTMPSAGTRILPGNDGGGNPSLPTAKPDHTRAMIKADHSGVVSAMVATGGRQLLQFEFDLVPLWRDADEEFITKKTALGGMDFDDKARQVALLALLTESTAAPWPPDLGGDPAKPRLYEVGRLFGLDTTGYERGVDVEGGEFGWRETDAGVPDSGDPMFPEAGALHPGPRMFKRVLKAASPIGEDGEARKHGFEQIRPNKLELFHPDYPATDGPGAGTTPFPYKGSWELDPERCAVRLLEPQLDTLAVFDVLTLEFATRARITLAINADFRIATGTADPGVASDFSPVKAYSNVRAEGSYKDKGLDADPERILQKVANERLLVSSVPNVSASIICDWIRTDVEPGHWIKTVTGRGIPIRGQVQEVHMDFVDQQTTIVLEDVLMFNTAPPLINDAAGSLDELGEFRFGAGQ